MLSMGVMIGITLVEDLAVIERDPDIIGTHISELYGDASHQELLLKAGADRIRRHRGASRN